MRALEFLIEDHHNKKDVFLEMFKKFLPLAMEIIKLKDLPRMVFIRSIKDSKQPTFGRYVTDEKTLYVSLANRHPNDILRTIAHELTHYKQDTEHKLEPDSGVTGSQEENEANAIAGIVMRNFNKRYPEYLTVKPIVLEKWSEKYKRSINCANPKGFSQRAHCQGRKKNEQIIPEKLNRTDSAELVIFDIDDTLLHTTALINVVRDGKVVRTLTNQEFNNYKLGPGEEFDFGQFRDADKFEEESVPIGPMLDKLRADLAAGKNVVMLTARADFNNQKPVWRTFKRHGIDINRDVHLFRAGNLSGDNSPAVKKAIHVSEWLSSGKYNKVTMYDDSEKNLAVFKSLEKRFPNVKFEAHHVSGSGETKQVEDADDVNQQDPGQPIPFPKGTTSISVSDPYDWYKLGMVISDLDDANPNIFGKGAPSTVIAFGSEEEEHKFLPYLKRLGLKIQDIDRPEDVQKVVPAKALIQRMQENFADGRNPQDKGDSQRLGIPKTASLSTLDKIGKGSGRKAQLARWQANMRRGRNKQK